MDDAMDTVVERVELFEDRVSVTRSFLLPEGTTHRIVVGPLSPLVHPGVVSVSSADDAVIVEEISFTRDLVGRKEADRPEAAQVRAELDAARGALTGAEAVRDAATLGATRTRIRYESTRTWAARALVEVDDARAWTEVARQLAEEHARAEIAVVAAEAAVARAEREVAHLEERLAMARAGSSPLRSFATLRIVGPEGAKVSLRYTIPCALWRPVHRARLTGGTVHWTVSAMAWNATGEDWDGVEMVFSTARPGVRATPPVLRDDRIVAVRKGREVVVEAREETIEVARAGEARAVDEVPGVDDGGEPRTFTASTPVVLPSDGKPVLVVLETWESEATVTWTCVPEESAAVIRTTRQVNGGRRPLLAGPVELFGEHGAMGRSRVELVPPGEPFDLGWGSHDDIRVARRQTHEYTPARIGGKARHTFDVALRVSHMGREPVDIVLRERVPVSELAAVTVTTPRATPPLAEGPDADGLCAWRLSLTPGTATELSLSYAVEAGGNVKLPW